MKIENEISEDLTKQDLEQDGVKEPEIKSEPARQPTPEEIKKEQEAFLNDPAEKAGALQLAVALADAIGEGRWTTLTQICKRTKMDRMQAITKLKTIEMFGYATVRAGDESDKLKYRGEPLWTIAIAPESKVKAIDGMIEETLAHIGNLHRLLLHKKMWLKEIAGDKKADKVN